MRNKETSRIFTHFNPTRPKIAVDNRKPEVGVQNKVIISPCIHLNVHPLDQTR